MRPLFYKRREVRGRVVGARGTAVAGAGGARILVAATGAATGAPSAAGARRGLQRRLRALRFLRFLRFLR
ncbi:hypothetical protein VI03_22860, partial [Burkholderia vietnamiensis]